jgi:hypothetical protein
VTDNDHPSLGAVLAYVRDTIGAAKLTPGQQAVALFVASHYNRRDGFARPSQAYIAETLGWHARSVAKALAALTAAGVWQVELSHTRAARYRFPIRSAVHTPGRRAGSELSTLPAEEPGTPGRGAGGVRAEGPGELSTEQSIGTRAPQAFPDAVPRGAPLTAREIDLIEIGL